MRLKTLESTMHPPLIVNVLDCRSECKQSTSLTLMQPEKDIAIGSGNPFESYQSLLMDKSNDKYHYD